MSILKVTFSIISLVIALYIKYLTPPWNFPRTIPTIPFYVTFLPFVASYDQEQIFAKYLKLPLDKYGAVKIYFGGRWNILVSHPKYLSVLFKKEHIFAKSGNHLKIGKSVIAAYTGENVISAHGKIWRVFRNTMTLGLTQFDEKPLYTNAKLFCNMIKQNLKTDEQKIKNSNSSSSFSTLVDEKNQSLEENKVKGNEDWDVQKLGYDSSQTLETCESSYNCSQKSGDVLMTDLIQRLALANISELTLGLDFGTLKEGTSDLHMQLKSVKSQIFKPIFLNFPFLDNYPIPSRVKARRDVHRFRKTLLEKVESNLLNNYEYEQTNFASSSLIKAEKNQEITKEQLINNLVIILVAGHENPQLIITTLFYLFGKFPYWQQKIREEICQSDKTLQELEKLPLLTAFMFEALRMYPPLSHIINRCTVQKTMLDQDIIIPQGAYVGYNVYGTGRNNDVWENANEFKPDRWGKNIDEINDNWKHCKQDCSIGAFHGGNRACLGEKLALSEVRVTFLEVLMNFEWSLAKDWRERVTPAGPLCPLNLKLSIQSLA